MRVRQADRGVTFSGNRALHRRLSMDRRRVCVLGSLMHRARPPLPPPGDYPRFATLGDVLRIFSNDRATHAVPPGTHWTWLSFPESWPVVTCDQGNYTGPGTPLGNPDDLFWFTLAELAEHQPDAIPAWLAQLLVREAAEFTGALAAAFIALGSVPLLWTVPNYPEPRMPAYQPHYRLAFGGALYTTEQWSCRLNITSAGDLPTDAEADAMLPGLVTALSNWVLAGNSFLSTAVVLDWVKFNEILPNGHYRDPDNSRTAEVLPAVYGTGDMHFPPQVATVVSLRTAHNRGKAHVGRMFTPAIGATLSMGMCGSGAAQAGTATTLLNAINAIVTPAGVSIISATGEANHVTHVAVGHIFDTMRTRRNALSEAPYAIGATLA